MSDAYDPQSDLERVHRYVSEHGAGVDQVAAMDALRRLSGFLKASSSRYRDVERIRELEAALKEKDNE